MRALGAEPDIYDKLMKSVAPSIWQMDDVKKGILCQLFGGSSKARPPHPQTITCKISGLQQPNDLYLGLPTTAYALKASLARAKGHHSHFSTE